jgi:anti-sigma B factor antagonist
MAIGRGQPVTGHGATAPLDALIQLSSQIGADGLAVITIRGDLDLATADRAVRYVKEVIDRHDGPVSADLSGVAFCDACGLGALIRITAYAEQAGRRLELARPSRSVARIMRLTHVDDRLLEPALVVLGGAGPTAAAAQLAWTRTPAARFGTPADASAAGG